MERKEKRPIIPSEGGRQINKTTLDYDCAGRRPMYACPDAGPQKIGFEYLTRVRHQKYSCNCYLAKTIAGSHDKRYEFTQLGTYQLITSVPDMIAPDLRRAVLPPV